MPYFCLMNFMILLFVFRDPHLEDVDGDGERNMDCDKFV